MLESRSMKKLLAIVVLGLLWCNSAIAEIIFKNCSGIYPNHPAGTVFKINLDRKVIHASEENGADFYFNIRNDYGEVYVTGDLIDGSEFSRDVIKIMNEYMPTKYTFDVSAKKISISVNLNPNATRSFKKWFKQNLNAGEVKTYLSGICEVENLYAKKQKPKNEDVNEVEASSGTAFFVTDKGHLITNNHVVEGCKDKSKIVYKDQEYPAKLIAKDKNLDFALLKADLSKNRFIELSENPPKKLQRIIAAGYPLGKYLSDDLKFTSGIVSSLKGYNDDSTLIQIDAALNPGNSGGPIVDENNGKLVAVAVAGLRKDKTEAVNFGIKSNSLRNFLNANQMKLQSKQLFSFGKNIDVSQILEESTVYTFCK